MAREILLGTSSLKLPNGNELKVGQELVYPTYNGFQFKRAEITHIVEDINGTASAICMSNGEVIDSATANVGLEQAELEDSVDLI